MGKSETGLADPPPKPSLAMKRFTVTTVTTIALALVGALASAQGDLVVETSSGPVQGFRSSNVTSFLGMPSGPVQGLQSSNSNSFNAFLGIPYASAGRWESPEDPDAWSEPFQANQYGPMCPQVNSSVAPVDELLFADQPWNHAMPPPAQQVQSEDCLRVNVYSPANASAAPVMVWIHGGALVTGDSGGFAYPAESLVAKDVVVVTFNYRLGALGYLAHPDFGDTNFGLYDQIKALEWVQKNIAAFGGDPDNVTIFGQSAGGASVAFLLVSPLSEKLFNRAIIQSGDTLQSQNVTAEDAEWMGVAVGEAMGIEAGSNQLEKMKEAPFNDVVIAQEQALSSLFPGLFPALVYIDGKSMETDALTGFLEGTNHKNVPVIMGTTENEGNLFWAGYVNMSFPIIGFGGAPALQQYYKTNTTENFEGFVRQVFKDDAEKVLSLYPADTPVASSEMMMTDTTFTGSTLMIADAMAGRGEDARLYHFTQKPEGKAGEVLGAFHGSELPYVGIGSQQINPIVNPVLADYMSSYWTNFAKTGDPNAAGLPEWQSLPSGSVSDWFVLGPEVGTQSIPQQTLEQTAVVKPIVLDYHQYQNFVKRYS